VFFGLAAKHWLADSLNEAKAALRAARDAHRYPSTSFASAAIAFAGEIFRQRRCHVLCMAPPAMAACKLRKRVASSKTTFLIGRSLFRPFRRPMRHSSRKRLCEGQ
jgi:hypothetical protein